APWWCKTNCVAYIHEVLGPIWTTMKPQPMSTIGRWGERWTHWLYRNVPFWTPSESTKKDLHTHGVRSVTVIPNGIDIKPLASLEDKPLHTPLRLICVSRVEPNKRVDHAVRMIKILADRNIPAQLTVVGDGASKPKLVQLVKELGLEDKVRLTGWLKEEQKN